MTWWQLENLATLAGTTIIVSVMVLCGMGGDSALGFLLLLNMNVQK